MAKTPEEKMSQHELELLAAKHATPPAPIAAQTEKEDLLDKAVASKGKLPNIEKLADWICNEPAEQVDAARLTYEQEVHALLCAAASNTESLLSYFEAQAQSESGDAKKLTKKCIEWKSDDLRRIRILIPQALERRAAASLKQETQPPRCPSGAQSGTVTESQRCIECGQTIPVGAECFYYRETGIFVHRKCPAASSSPLETPATEPKKMMIRFEGDTPHEYSPDCRGQCTPAPADTGMTYLESAQKLASTGDTPQPQECEICGAIWLAKEKLPCPNQQCHTGGNRAVEILRKHFDAREAKEK